LYDTRAGIQKKRFVLPQESTEMESYFYNKQVYGNVNILWVTGAIRLDSSSTRPVLDGKVTFDVWPPESAKLDFKTYRKKEWDYEDYVYGERHWSEVE
jgi:hypothetical protein